MLFLTLQRLLYENSQKLLRDLSTRKTVPLSSSWFGFDLQTLNPLTYLLFLCISCYKAQNQGMALFLQLCFPPLPSNLFRCKLQNSWMSR